MKELLKHASSLIGAGEDHIKENIHNHSSSVAFYKDSVQKTDGTLVAMACDSQSKFILVFSSREDGIIADFSGEQIGDCGVIARKCPLNEHNAQLLRKLFPWTAPVSLRNRKTTIGCGDRLGLASIGHIAAVKHFDATPVLAQQSMRELDLTGRTYRQVVDDTTFMVFQAGYKDGYGADGDHLKNIPDIVLRIIIRVGFLDVNNYAGLVARG